MFSHVTVGTNDMEISRRFYDALFTAVGGRAGVFDDEGKLVYIKDGRMFMVIPPIDGQAACHANGGTIGFHAKTSEMVQAFHDAGVAAGGRAIEDPPGARNGPFGPMILAYLRDPSGNKICAMHRTST